MKKAMIAVLAAGFIFAGCSKEEMKDPVSSSNSQQIEAMDGMDATVAELILTPRGVDQNSIKIPLSDLRSKGPKARSTMELPAMMASRGPSLSLTDISGVKLQATQNGDDTHIQVYACGSLIDLIVSSSCTQEHANESAFIGQITWVNNDGGFPKFFEVGNHLIYKTVNNGSGSEHFSNSIFVYDDNPGDYPVCSVDLLDVLPWPSRPAKASSALVLQ